MSVTLTIQCEAHQLTEHLRNLLALNPPSMTAETPTPRNTRGKSEGKVAGDPPAAPKAESAAPAQPAQPAQAASAAPTVGDYISRLAREKGKPVAVEILGKFGAKRGQDLKPEDHAKFIAAAKEALAA